MFNSQCSILSRRIRIEHWELNIGQILGLMRAGDTAKLFLRKPLGHDPNPSIRGVGAPMDGLSASPWMARWCQGTLPCGFLVAHLSKLRDHDPGICA